MDANMEVLTNLLTNITGFLTISFCPGPGLRRDLAGYFIGKAKQLLARNKHLPQRRLLKEGS